MKYLIIAMVIAALISPLMALKPSRRQKKLVALRDAARQCGLQVQVCADAIYDEDGNNPTSTRYYVPWLAKDLEGDVLKPWLLVRSSPRGRPSVWSGWCWHRHEASPRHQAALANIVFELPKTVNGVSADSKGIGVYWQESDSVSSLLELEEQIKKMYRNIN